MRSKPLELHAEAEQDYLNALDWYRSQSLPAAERFYNAFWQAIQTVEDAPQRWPVYLSHFRRYNLHDFPFSIVYREELVWAFHDGVEMGPKMLARIAKHTGLRVEDL
jgi:hypothetical protein